MSAATPQHPTDEMHSPGDAEDGGVWNLRLYVADGTPRSALAYQNLVAICEEYLPGNYAIEVIDVLAQPRLACEENIVALPAVVLSPPGPTSRKVIGTLGDRERVAAALGLKAPDTTQRGDAV